MSPKCFWFLSDNKTVREISHEELLKLHRQKREHKLLMVFPTGSFMVFKGCNNLWISRRQLKQIWEGVKA